MKKILAVCFIVIVFTSGLFAQENIIQDSSWYVIPTLKVILDSAMSRSPLLLSKLLNKDIVDLNLKFEKKKWADFIYVEGAINYGLYDQFLISGVNQPGYSKNEQTRYYGGLGIKLPVSTVTNRKTVNEVYKIKADQARCEYRDAQSTLKQIIIDAYFNLKYSEESLKAFLAMYKTLEISYFKAEQDVKIGLIAINEFALISSAYGKSKDDYFKAKNNFYAEYFKLEEISGLTFKR